MKTIHKFPFEVEDEVVITMPRTARVVLVECQNDQPCMWAIVDTREEPAETRFFVTGTGHPAPDAREHLASFQQGPFVWHVWKN
jgi:hypothetical protein